MVEWSTCTRWGKSTCPSVSGTTLVYAGRAGGTWWQHKGGADNFLCMPDDPDYLSYTPGVQGYSYVYGAEYQSHHGPLSAVSDHNVPCAVCYASTRVAVTMIPAKTQCPTNWTLEYSGYLMSQKLNWHHKVDILHASIKRFVHSICWIHSSAYIEAMIQMKELYMIDKPTKFHSATSWSEIILQNWRTATCGYLTTIQTSGLLYYI